MKRWVYWLPFLVFTTLSIIAVVGLWRPADRTVRSALVGKPLPGFAMAPMLPGKPGLDRATFTRGKPRLLNIFASWCIPCAAEAPQLARLKAAGVAIDAVAIRDTPEAVRGFLDRYGDPYQHIGSDPESSLQLALGSSGVPETFVIDGNGTILLQHVGEIRADDVPDLLAALGRAK
ncbi:redoxin family protein [Sphingomonas sp.]|uniref:redoxin family protein n=1 Tax=Sphingomonas sp. TaxID=28214 RepID=UPI001D3273C4|nr:redoxin family protein [Sphingomonas sp.]MBX9797798.1 redoxin family protein [Sphingomonas sp.]